MLKHVGEFLATGMVVIISYVIYFFSMLGATFILGLPVALGIKLLLDAINVVFANTSTN